MNFLRDAEVSGKSVLVRLDLDLPQNSDGEFDTTRMEDGFETLINLWQRKAKDVTVIAHRGHEPQPTPEFSLLPITELIYNTLLKQPTMREFSDDEIRSWLTVKENLRFDHREEEASLQFAEELASGHDLFVNDAFATSHRKHTSIVMIPKILPTVFGFQFETEVKVFQRVLEHPDRPFIFVLGGAKLETKLPLLENMGTLADAVLVGGKLAVEAHQTELTYSDNLKQKMQIAEITEDTLDISDNSAARFGEIIQQGKTIVWNGPMGKFEDGVHAAGTLMVGTAISLATQAGAYSLIGGGDTEAALSTLDLEQPGNFSHICPGGGAMIYYLAHGTLPAIEAVEAAATNS
jgi:3-phosphoglycerate kinase